jgi:hypothetical protein
MRRVSGIGTEKIGGAWQCAAIMSTDGVIIPGPPDAARNASATNEDETKCTDAGCTKGACIVGIVLQQS